MKKVNVCIITPSYPTKVEPYSAFFIRDQAVALKNEGCKISVVAPRIFGRGKLKSKIDDIVIYNFSFLTKNKRLAEYKKIPIMSMISYIISGVIMLFKVVRKEHCDIIHAHWATPTGFIAIIVGKYFLRKQVVVTAHGSDILVFPQRSRLIRIVTKFTLKKADRIITVSRLLEDTVSREFKINKSKIDSIALGIDLSLFKHGDQKQARKKIGLPLDKQILLYVGDLVEVKGLNYLMNAIPEILKSNPNTLCILIGEGSQREILEKQALELGINPHIQFLGYKPHNEIPFWMNAADIFILPSLSEGAGVSLIEAMAVGLPVVSTNVGYASELVENRGNIILIKSRNSRVLAEKITLLSNKKNQISGSKSTFNHLDNFDMISTTAKVKATYESLLNENKHH